MMLVGVLCWGHLSVKSQSMVALNQSPTTKASKTGLTLSQPFPPAIVHQDLLNYLEMYSSGIFDMSYVSVAFLPEKDQNGKTIDYQNEKRLHVKFKKGEQELFDKYYTATYTGNRLYKKFKTRQGRYEQTLEAGQYAFEFYLDDRLISVFPFEVVVKKNSDPYAKVGEKRFYKGMWNNYGYLSWEKRSDTPRLYWNIFKQTEKLDKQRDMIKVYCELYKNGKYYANTGKVNGYGKDITDLQIQDYWGKYKMVFFKGPQNKPIKTDWVVKKKDLQDGNYEIRMFTNGKRENFLFKVQGGKIVTGGRQDRAKTHPTKFIEGLNKAWWIKKQ